MQAIITGPTGAVGMGLLENLIENNIKTAVVLRPGSKRADRIIKSSLITKVECGLEELEKLPQLLVDAGFDVGNEDNKLNDFVFYHLGWDGTFGNTRNNMYGQNLNVKYSLDAVKAAAACGCDTFVGTGSQAEYGRVEGSLNANTPVYPENGYGIAKLCAGQMTRIMCGQLGIRHIWTRILSIYGPYDGDKTMVMSTIEALLQKREPACTAGEQKWDYLYSKDAGKALYLIGKNGINGKVYCLGSGKVRPLREYIEIMKNKIDANLSVGYGKIPYSEKQVFYLQADIEDLTKDTGFIPETDFEDGIEKTIEYVKKVLLEN